jgi:mono/diheme cytochrome c family protein
MDHRTRIALVLAGAFAALCAATLASAADAPSPLAPARATFEGKCASCHPLERSLAKQAYYEGWKTTVKRMIAKGAALTQKDADQVIAYLSAKSLFETKCNGCHDLAKPLAAIKNVEEWRATVAVMAAKKPPLLAEEEAIAISQYLALSRPAAAAPAAPAYK